MSNKNEIRVRIINTHTTYDTGYNTIVSLDVNVDGIELHKNVEAIEKSIGLILSGNSLVFSGKGIAKHSFDLKEENEKLRIELDKANEKLNAFDCVATAFKVVWGK